MQDKRTSLAAAIGSIRPGARLALGGNTLHRGPCAAVHEIVRQGIGGLEIVKTAGAYDVDLLAATGLATSASVGFVGFETVYGLAPNYRRAVEAGSLTVNEHACYSVIAGLRAAIQGVPFMPIAGMFGSDLIAARGFKTIADPYTGEEVVAIPALTPDVAIIHVQEADEFGNARIIGGVFEDALMAQAARRVIVTAERIVDGALFEATPELVSIPALYVDAVVEAPRGAAPCGCAGEYGYDRDYLDAYIAASRDPERLRRFIAERILAPALAAA